MKFKNVEAKEARKQKHNNKNMLIFSWVGNVLPSIRYSIEKCINAGVPSSCCCSWWAWKIITMSLFWLIDCFCCSYANHLFVFLFWGPQSKSSQHHNSIRSVEVATASLFAFLASLHFLNEKKNGDKCYDIISRWNGMDSTPVTAENQQEIRHNRYAKKAKGIGNNKKLKK